MIRNGHVVQNNYPPPQKTTKNQTMPRYLFINDKLNTCLRLLHTRVTSSKYFEKRKFFNLDEGHVFFLYHLMR